MYKKDQIIAFLLALFLGGLGAHKFYLGKPLWGLLYLFGCWTFIPMILGAFEGAYYLMHDAEDWDKEYNCGKGVKNVN